MESEMTLNITDLPEGEAIEEEIADVVSEYISDRTGFCIRGFCIDVTVYVTNIDYDKEEG